MEIATGVKQKIIGVITVLTIFIILGALFISERPQNSELLAYEAQLQKIFEDAKNQFEYIRNVTLPSEIKLFVYTKQQAIDRWGEDSFGLDASNVLRQENIYKSLFLIEENESLDGVIMDWVASWTAVSVGNEIYVIYENYWPWDMPNAEAVLIHELTHVWQAALPVPTSYDVNRAYNALLEGDAVYMADYYKAQYNNSTRLNYANSLFISLVFPQLNAAVYPSVSDTVSTLNLFSYTYGKSFVSTLIDNGGWDQLNQSYLFEYVPSATAHILHFDKYFAGETAIFVLAPIPVDNNWVRIPSSYGYLSDTYGEFFVYVMLNNWLSDSKAQEVASGWAGDSFSYYEKDCDFLFVWNITWSSTECASEFTQAFSEMLNIVQANPQGDFWFTNGRYLTLSWNPNEKSTLILCSTDQTVIDPSLFTC
ncbi:MAG: basic secretory family protein [Nitrososphaerota archaeon]|jgi:hypothetical protein|nr:basic secretory family protein [Nitrososphaerota archaeon]